MLRRDPGRRPPGDDVGRGRPGRVRRAGRDRPGLRPPRGTGAGVGGARAAAAVAPTWVGRSPDTGNARRCPAPAPVPTVIAPAPADAVRGKESRSLREDHMSVLADVR